MLSRLLEASEIHLVQIYYTHVEEMQQTQIESFVMK